MTDSIDKKQNIIETTIRLFATNGFAGTSIRDIEKASGANISNIYYYFGSKYGLLLGVLEFLSQRLEGALKQVTELDMNPLDRFKELVMTHLDYLVRYSFEARVAFSEETILSPATNKINKQFQRNILNLYRKELRRMQTAGYLKDINISLAAFNVLGVIQWHQRWYRPEGSLSLDQIKEEAIAFIMNGLLRNAKPPGNNK